ncbi:MAG: DUF2127 domain-containing protein [Acidobacteria bacterium]|nr:MAG: DUF2127 domain-containing protein [Acidobacteriota bacterium]
MGTLNHKFGLRAVAALEVSKGLAVLALSVLLLSLLHKDLNLVVDQVTDWLRLNPDSQVADWFYELADRTTGSGIRTAVAVGFVYSTGRFVEAYGLWKQRRWAEWFAVLAGAIYLPFELFALILHPHWTKVAVIVGNLAVVLYILRILLENRRDAEELAPKVQIEVRE